MTNHETVLAFIRSINARDADGLGDLMSDDHRFIDALGNEVVGKEKMILGWRGYFEWFPDYWIEINEVFAGETSAGEQDICDVRIRRRLVQRTFRRELAYSRGLESDCERRP